MAIKLSRYDGGFTLVFPEERYTAKGASKLPLFVCASVICV
jgi:hypothetical protein